MKLMRLREPGPRIPLLHAHRLGSVKKAADAAGRKICFIGMSLHTYLDAAWKDGRAPFDPREVLSVQELEDHDPSKVLVVTTGAQVGTLPPGDLCLERWSHKGSGPLF